MKPKMKIVSQCPQCHKEQKPDPVKSTQNWAYYDCKEECPDCHVNYKSAIV